MSKVAIQGNVSGTGTVTLAAPNTNTDRTLTLPDEAGTVLTSASDVAASQITTALNATGSAPIYACRAWVNFDAQSTGSPVISSSGNVSSITDNAVGKFTVNFTTGFSSTPAAAGGMTITNYPGVMRVNAGTVSCQIFCAEAYNGTSYRDPSRCGVVVFGD
jgi:hypothetical protein